MMRSIFVAMVLGLGLICGCTTVPKDPRISEQSLKGKVAVSFINDSVDPKTNHSKVQIELLGKEISTLSLQYKIEWFDRGGGKMSSVMERWTDFSVLSQGLQTLNFVSPQPDPGWYRVQIRKKNSSNVGLIIDSRAPYGK